MTPPKPEDVMRLCHEVQARHPNDPKVSQLIGAVYGLVDVLKKTAPPGDYTVSGDGIGKLMDCVREGRHIPLNFVPNDPHHAGIWLRMPDARIFGRAKLCMRCGLQYWEAVDPDGNVA